MPKKAAIRFDLPEGPLLLWLRQRAQEMGGLGAYLKHLIAQDRERHTQGGRP